MPKWPLLTVEEASDKLAVSVDVVREWCRYGVLKAHKANGKWHIDYNSVRIKREAMLEARGEPV